ncbi:hypothetical protein [Legionella hackeliae]|uniref:Uncharacterized protein n=1 Tax=Legionella hackeliae TaxID=449 RepID=A0A0A8UVJ0_LEGHA|nr:hypothetical protein [Legionella hackeliae]KTD13164.1 hypothetical protein Lhac_1033 [Legionella hackeliae]CEK11526.1 protein of unknown function [Legionella hackeliae]STX48293.1 Uncharacterised protein [Legionella hackeliae]
MIIDYLFPRDIVLLFYDKNTQKMVATIGISIVCFKNDVLIYFGNVVVDFLYKQCSCISDTTAKYVSKIFIRYPFKNKYCCGLASSSGALKYSMKHKPASPNLDEKTPENLTQLMINTVHQ